MLVNDLEIAYTTPSQIQTKNGLQELVLAHHTEIEEVQNIPCFFWGSIVEPLVVAKCLGTIAKIVRSSYAPIPVKLYDPIVSTGTEQIRFEGFSSCNGIYARLDLLENSVEGEFIASGTTNVDFNEPMLNALNAVKKNEVMVLGVGEKEVKVSTSQGTIIEKKVKLPQRWIKGLTSVQVYLAEMTERFELNKLQTIQMLQSIPKGKNLSPFYLSFRANRYQFSPILTINSVYIGGIERLQLLQGLLPYIEKSKIYQAEDAESCAICLYLSNMRFTLVLSPANNRGFSGEGNVLENMLQDIPLEYVHAVNGLCKANESFNPTLLSIEHTIDFTKMDQLTASLSSIGLLGFDLHHRQHYYRRLPFKIDRILSLNPRLKNAKTLVKNDEVRLIKNTFDDIEAQVTGTDMIHTVLIKDGQAKCTCEWFNQHQSKRGFCKHILAVKIATA